MSPISSSSLVAAPRPGRSGLAGWLAPGLLHALILDADGQGVRHYERAQDRPDRPWVRGDLVSPDAVGPAALVVARGVLHALVPESSGIAHHVCAALPRRTTPSGHTLDPNAWGRREQVLPGGAVSAWAGREGVLAAVADDRGVTVSRLDQAWERELFAPRAAAPALASRSLVVERDGHLQWWRWAGRWRPVGEVGVAGTAPHALIVEGDGWLLAVPREDVLETWRLGPDGSITRHATLTWGAGRIDGVALARAERGALHALTVEDGSIFQHRRHHPDAAWHRVNCLRLHDDAPFDVEPEESRKLAQVSGEVDTQPLREGGRRPTLSRSATTAGVQGTDLGVRVTHAGEDFLLFGDTHWRKRPWLTTRDAIARLTPDGPIPGLPGVEFHGAPLRVTGGVTLREYDVPLDGFSQGDDFYAFFTSNHFWREQVMGRSVLAVHRGPLRVDPRSRRPITFSAVGTFSTRHFINVSVQAVPAASVGWPGEGDVLLLFGAGSYRAGDLRLAVLDPREGVERAGVRYWAGTDAAGAPRWVAREADARPLLHPGAFGEISVRWVPELDRFVLLACSGPEDPIGWAVTLRTAETPWGPWSPRRRLLDWIARGMWFDDPYARFIKARGDGTDPVGDRVFKGQADATGAAYAPYFFDARADGDDVLLRYTLSTWNPYQVVLMEHRLAGAGLAPGRASPTHG